TASRSTDISQSKRTMASDLHNSMLTFGSDWSTERSSQRTSAFAADGVRLRRSGNQVPRTPTVADARSIRRREDGPMSQVRRFDHIGVTVADLDVVTAFFVALGLE